MINYDGIDEATLIHGLYHGTPPLGFDTPARLFGEEGQGGASAVTIETVTAEIPLYTRGERIGFDYFHGRALKISLDMKAKTFEERFYDRDAGQGAAQRVVEGLRSQVAVRKLA